jgi:flagellar operon protein
VSQPIPNAALLPPGIAGPSGATGGAAAGGGTVTGPSFGDVLARTHSVSFSRHALQRLERRGIELGDHALARLGDGVDRAAGKGSRSSVVFVDGTAFVVAVPKRTVLTAVDPEHMREQVFTNIDSAVIA